MKIKWLLSFGFWALILFCKTSPLFADDFFTKSTHASFYWDGEAHGGKIVFPLAEFRLYETADRMNTNYGFTWFTEKFIPSFPCSIKCGNLTPGGLYSKLKNPLLNTSVTPFGTVSSETDCVTAKLPGYSSFARPPSYYFQFGFSDKELFLRNLKFSFFNSDEENIQVLSGLVKMTFFEKLHLSLSYCSGYFDYSEKNSTSWFVQTPCYHKGVHFCSASQFLISSPHQKSLFSLAMFESPFGGLQNVYRLESQIKGGRFIFSLGGVYLPGTILTCDGTTESELAQVKGGLQGHWITGNTFPVLVKAGLNTYCKINLTQEEHPLKMGGGIQFTLPITVFAISSTVGAALKVSSDAPVQILFNSLAFQIQNTWYLKNLVPSFSIAKSYTPNSDFTATTIKDSYELSCSFSANPSVSEKAKYEITRKDGEKSKQEASFSLTLTENISCISITGKFSLLLKF